jgi:hypothetical protein
VRTSLVLLQFLFSSSPHLVVVLAQPASAYTSEFDCFTCDIKEVCSRENYLLAKWFDLPLDETKRSVPATMDEIRALGLEKCLIGTKADMGL